MELSYDVTVEFEAGVGVRIDSEDPSDRCDVCRADVAVCDVDLGVVEVGVHD